MTIKVLKRLEIQRIYLNIIKALPGQQNGGGRDMVLTSLKVIVWEFYKRMQWVLITCCCLLPGISPATPLYRIPSQLHELFADLVYIGYI